MNYFVEKLLYPKVAVIDRPGIIISKTSSWYSSSSQKRLLFHFEDLFVANQLAAVRKIGKKKASELYYCIGKDVGYRYMLLSGAKPPKILHDKIIQYISRTLASTGFTVFSKCRIGEDIVFTGSDSMYCRKSGIGDISAGLISGVISYLKSANIEAKKTSCSKDSRECKIIVGKKIKTRYKVSKKGLKITKNYAKMNFAAIPVKSAQSFSDLIKFKFVKIDKRGLFNIKGLPILPTEAGFAGIVYTHFKKIGIEQALIQSIKTKSKEIVEEILPDIKLKDVLNLICCFGWGIPNVSRNGTKLILSLRNPPFTKYGYNYQAHEFAGYLSAIYKKASLVSLTEKWPIIHITYSITDS